MSQIFNVIKSGKKVGTAEVEYTGLYSKITCYCTLPAEKFHKIIVQGNLGSVNLGTCLPVNGKFVLNAKVATKHIGRENLVFYIQDHSRFVPITEEQKFDYLGQLIQSRLDFQNDTAGIWITEEKVRQDSDLNLRHPSK